MAARRGALARESTQGWLAQDEQQHAQAFTPEQVHELVDVAATRLLAEHNHKVAQLTLAALTAVLKAQDAAEVKQYVGVLVPVVVRRCCCANCRGELLSSA